MNYEVTIPGQGAEDLVLNLTVEAPNWLEALRNGLAEVGNELVPSDSEIDIQPDGVIRVLQRSTQRTFVVRPLSGDAQTSRRRQGTGRKQQTATAPQIPQVDAAGNPVNPAFAPATTSNIAPSLPFEPEHPTPIVVSQAAQSAVMAPPPPPQLPLQSAHEVPPPPVADRTSTRHIEPPPGEPRPRQRMTPIPPNKVAQPPAASVPPAARRPEPTSTPHRFATSPVSSMAPPILTGSGSALRPPPGMQAGNERFGTTPLSKAAVRDAHAAAFAPPQAQQPPEPGMSDEQLMAMIRDALPRIEKEFVTAEQVIDAAVDLAANTIPSESTLFLLPAGDPRRGRVVAARGATVKGFLGTVLPLTDDVANVLLGRKSVVILNEVDWTLRFQGRHQGILSLDVRSIAWAPILHRGRLVSTLVLTNSKRSTGFTQTEHTALEQMCMSLAKTLVMYL